MLFTKIPCMVAQVAAVACDAKRMPFGAARQFVAIFCQILACAVIELRGSALRAGVFFDIESRVICTRVAVLEAALPVVRSEPRS